jgi:hypothetical protein
MNARAVAELAGCIQCREFVHQGEALAHCPTGETRGSVNEDGGELKVTQSGENWFVEAPGDIQRIEACLSGVAYAPHRHDTYTIGITLSGIQSFTYRGAGRASYPGQIVILHPDEKHDGLMQASGRTTLTRNASISRTLVGQNSTQMLHPLQFLSITSILGLLIPASLLLCVFAVIC